MLHFKIWVSWTQSGREKQECSKMYKPQLVREDRMSCLVSEERSESVYEEGGSYYEDNNLFCAPVVERTSNNGLKLQEKRFR